MDIDDNNIIKSVQSGDYKAYSHLIQRYKKPVFNLAFRMTGSYDEADDLSQDIFIRAFESLNHFDTRKKFPLVVHNSFKPVIAHF